MGNILIDSIGIFCALLFSSVGLCMLINDEEDDRGSTWQIKEVHDKSVIDR